MLVCVILSCLFFVALLSPVGKGLTSCLSCECVAFCHFPKCVLVHIRIPKPGKDPAEQNNYRPIALASCLCKTLERMVNKRLTWFLESNNHISRFQSGFRSDRSTTDNLVRLEKFIRDAFIKKEHVVAVFF